jgi:hypothetical protein
VDCSRVEMSGGFLLAHCYAGTYVLQPTEDGATLLDLNSESKWFSAFNDRGFRVYDDSNDEIFIEEFDLSGLPQIVRLRVIPTGLVGFIEWVWLLDDLLYFAGYMNEVSTINWFNTQGTGAAEDFGLDTGLAGGLEIIPGHPIAYQLGHNEVRALDVSNIWELTIVQEYAYPNYYFQCYGGAAISGALFLACSEDGLQVLDVGGCSPD